MQEDDNPKLSIKVKDMFDLVAIIGEKIAAEAPAASAVSGDHVTGGELLMNARTRKPHPVSDCQVRFSSNCRRPF